MDDMTGPVALWPCGLYVGVVGYGPVEAAECPWAIAVVVMADAMLVGV